MTIFIVEDNPNVRRFLLQVIPTFDDSYQIIGVSSSVEEALISLRAQSPDVLILDIELPDGNGFDILKKWNKENEGKIFGVQIIFATAHNHYALQAIKFSALDYLLKPISITELQEALQKASKNIHVDKFMMDKINVLQQNLLQIETQNSENAVHKQNIVLSDAERIHLVNIHEVIRCEANGSYTTFFLNGNKQITMSKSIKTIEQMLPDSIFYRVHRSHLINLTFFDFLDKKDGGTIHLKGGTILPIAIRRKDALIHKLRLL